MLAFFQNKRNQKIVYIVLFLLIAPPFLLWGIVESMNEKRSPSVLGTFDGKKVALRDYLAAYRAVHHGILLTYGDKAGYYRKFINVQQEAWDRLILFERARKLKLVATDEEVLEWLKRQSIFADRGGVFDPKLYQRIITQFLRTNTRSFEEEVRQSLSIEKVRASVQSRVTLGDGDLKNLYDQEFGKRKLVYALLSWETQRDAATITDEETEALYQVVKDQLTEPEKSRLRYVFIPEAEAEARKEALADERSSIDELAARYSLTPKQTDFFSKNDAVPDIGLSRDLLVFSFREAVGSLSPWTRTERGYYKAELVERKPERRLELAEAKQTLKDLMTREQGVQAAAAKLKEWAAQLGDQDFQTFFQSKGADVRQLDDFAGGVAIPGVGLFPAVQASIFGVRAGQTSPVLTYPQGALIVRVLEETPADAAQFEKDKSRFAEVAQQRLAQDEFENLLERLRERLKIDAKAMSTLLAAE